MLTKNRGDLPHPTTPIIVIEDSLALRDATVKMLRGIGLVNVTTAADGNSGWDIMVEKAQLGKPFQLVVCDWNMPGFTGLRVLQNVRASEIYRGAVFVMATSENNIDHVKDALDAGVDQYLLKPFGVEQLAEKLQNAWKKRHPKS